MHLARTRSLFFLVFFACALIVGAVIYLQRVVGSAPCPLCFAQRILMLTCSGICLIAALHGPGAIGWRVYSAILLFVSLIGAALAGRQVWLQATPPENPAACLVNLQYLLDTQPWLKVLALIFAGHAGCSEITWSLFGISLPEWSLLAFAGISLFALYYLFIEFRRFRSMEVGSAD
ncbi:disulfide bond formation protein B [Pseudomonas bohemica]|jgi:disulfide bond formation protein DsbB|uniref:disulfide bond formation protein B n=1 Tax=Pseudomonas bohemica TaxID=2044872 RepID=UPI000DA63EF2|nr:disulfide bond formation protein B [Pseudomonas bohemica]